MEHSDSEVAADTNVADTSVEKSEAPPTRPSAIERQIATASSIGYGYKTGPDRGYHYARHRRLGLGSFFVLLLFVAAGITFVFIKSSGPLRDPVVSAALHFREQVAAITQTRPATAHHTVASKQATDVANPGVVSVPIADISVRDRPELLVQLVQVYRSQLANKPNDSAAQAALNRLQQQSLSQLEIIMAAGDEPISAKSLEIVSQLFPELKGNPRYTSLIVRRGQIQREEKFEPPPEPQSSTVLTTAISAPPAALVTNAPVKSSPVKNISPPSESLAEIAKKPDAIAASTKPQIRVLSVTPGTMIDQRFVPSDEGTAFMVEISYRNFKNSDDQSEGTLVALLGTPGDPTALAEVPVDISGDRGTKSFVMETLIPGNTGEKYRLNFMLNGEFLASSTVRLSVPK